MWHMFNSGVILAPKGDLQWKWMEYMAYYWVGRPKYMPRNLLKLLPKAIWNFQTINCRALLKRSTFSLLSNSNQP